MSITWLNMKYIRRKIFILFSVKLETKLDLSSNYDQLYNILPEWLSPTRFNSKNNILKHETVT